MSNKYMDFAVKTCILQNLDMPDINTYNHYHQFIVKCVEDDKIFDSMQSCAAYYKVSSAAIHFAIKRNSVLHKINKTFEILGV